MFMPHYHITHIISIKLDSTNYFGNLSFYSDIGYVNGTIRFPEKHFVDKDGKIKSIHHTLCGKNKIIKNP